MSAEKREQYRNRLVQSYLNGYYGEESKEEPSFRDEYEMDGAVSVAATVLLDLHQYFDGDGVAQEGIRAFAGEHGIELGETS